MTARTRIRSGAATDVGRRRRNNQDAHLVDEHERLFAVADGMGGYAGGEVASQTAIDALHRTFPTRPNADGLEQAVIDANRAVIEKASSDPDLRQMGTTLSAAALVTSDNAPEAEGEGDVFAIAHVGDSRIYLLRDGELSQLTDDHTVSEEMKRTGQLTDAEALIDTRRHILTRVLGPRDDESPDMQTIVPYTGDRLVLCSDGLYNEVEDSGIAKVLRTIVDPNDAAQRLVDLANQAGGGDNITVVIVDVVDDDDRAGTASRALHNEPASRHLMTADERNAQLRRLDRESDDAPTPWSTPSDDNDSDGPELPTRRITARVIVFIVLLITIVGAAIGAIGWYARASYYVGLDEGRVAIFKGRPGGLLVFQPTVEEPTDLTEAEVPDARIEDVIAGHEVASMDEARRYVTNLRRDRELTTTAPATTTTAAPPTTTAPAPPP